MKLLSDILKPKSVEDINNEIQKMETFEFVYKFQKYNMKSFNINLKKKIAFFFSIKFIKYNKFYWIIYASWIILFLISHWGIPKSGMFFTEKCFIDDINRIFWFILIAYLFLMIMSLIVNRGYVKWIDKNLTGTLSLRISEELIESISREINYVNLRPPHIDIIP